MRVLLVDNYDSFTYNLFQYLAEMGAPVRVAKNDALQLDEVRAYAPSHVVLSPGPGTVLRPSDFGVSAAIIRELKEHTPILGVCLGHQGIAHALGARIVRAPAPVHGKPSRVRHDGSVLFAGLPPVIEVMRYHSLMVDPHSLPEELVTTAWTEDGALPMALMHQRWPLFGIQFHPESIGTPHGRSILQAFLQQG